MTVIIAQHMKEEVIPFYIKDLQDSLKVKVLATPHTLDLYKPSIIVCQHSTVLQQNATSFSLETAKEHQYYTPDIDKLLLSFVPYINDFELSALIMTGIGDDGVRGASELHKMGATIYAQDEASSPVYGMPKAAMEAGIVKEVKNIVQIIQFIEGR